jgi:endonuclease G, mitochondrial
MEHNQRQQLIDLLAKNAVGAPAATGVTGFFRGVILGANLPDAFKQERVGGWTGDARTDALELVNWALSRDINPADTRYTTLGSLLEPKIDQLDFNDATRIATLIVSNRLFRDQRLLNEVAVRFQIPRQDELASPAVQVGPEINWRGPADDVQLQSWLQPEPSLLDVGFLARAVASSASVCRVEVGVSRKSGTGVLLDSEHVLTNYHVLGESDEEVAKAAPTTTLRFGAYTLVGGESGDGQTVSLDPAHPVARSSPKGELDFVLLRAHVDVRKLKDVRPAKFSITPLPMVRSAVNILQHPEGKVMMLSASNSGVTGVYPQPGVLQYVSRTALGSSGSPCFDDQWHVIALHHAVRGRTFGVIGEGILITNIYERIKGVLTALPS